MLAPEYKGIGNWQILGRKFGLDQFLLAAMKSDRNSNESAEEVLQYIETYRPNLTVVAFCEVMKKMKQNKIVKLLENDFITMDETEEATSGKVICLFVFYSSLKACNSHFTTTIIIMIIIILLLLTSRCSMQVKCCEV
jgi:hypothetical protein